MANKITLLGGFEVISIPDGHFRRDPTKDGKELVPHVCCVVETHHQREVTISAQVLRSMAIRKDPYVVTFTLDPNSRSVVYGRCSCPAGLSFNCKHAAALYFYINNERSESKTDRKQAWKAPSSRLKELYPKGETIERLMTNVDVFETKVSTQKGNDFTNLVQALEKFNLTNASLFKSLTATPDQNENSTNLLDDDDAVPDFIERMFNQVVPYFDEPRSFSLTEPAHKFFVENVQCTPSQALNIFKSTFGQSKNPTWFTERKPRISASVAHQISRARTNETRLQYFFGSVVDHPNFRYGREMEPLAFKKYTEITNNVVNKSGLIVRSDVPWIAASPDGLILDKEELVCLEIKCPSSCANKAISVDYLDDEFKLKNSHPYFTQVQIQMFCSNAKRSHFFVYSSADYVFLEIGYDETFV